MGGISGLAISLQGAYDLSREDSSISPGRELTNARSPVSQEIFERDQLVGRRRAGWTAPAEGHVQLQGDCACRARCRGQVDRVRRRVAIRALVQWQWDSREALDSECDRTGL